MFVKLLIVTIALLAALCMLARRPDALARRGSARTAARLPRADDLVGCGRCGVWRQAGRPCDCGGGLAGDGA